jgi:hypothetical protein
MLQAAKRIGRAPSIQTIAHGVPLDVILLIATVKAYFLAVARLANATFDGSYSCKSDVGSR